MKKFVGSLVKFAEEQTFDHGLIGGVTDFGEIHKFTSGSIMAVILSAADFIGCSVRDAEMFQPGEINFSITETAEGIAATAEEIAKFQAGKIRLWVADYFLYISEIVETSPDEITEVYNELKELTA